MVTKNQIQTQRKQIMNNSNDCKIHKCIPNNITIDDVAHLCYKIGTEIWGEDHFLEMMEISKPPVQPTLQVKQGVA